MPLNLAYYYPLDGGGVAQPAIQDGVTAHAGGAQASAFPMISGWNRVTTVGSAADSVILPPANDTGSMVLVVNAAAANSMNVFPGVGDAINALSANTAIACAANKTMAFFCIGSGRWHSMLTA